MRKVRYLEVPGGIRLVMRKAVQDRLLYVVEGQKAYKGRNLYAFTPKGLQAARGEKEPTDLQEDH